MILGQVLVLFIEKIKNTDMSLSRALLTLALTSALLSRHLTLVFIIHQGQNGITIQPNTVLFHHFETTAYKNL